MKKHLLWLIFLFVAVMNNSCKKQGAGISQDAGSATENNYKEMLSSIVSIKPYSPSTDGNPGVNLKFETYKDAYAFFSKLMHKEAVSGQANSPAGITAVSSFQPTFSTEVIPVESGSVFNSEYVYGGDLHATASLDYSFGLVEMTFGFHLRVTMFSPNGATLTYVKENLPSNPMASYGGPGTLTGPPYAVIKADYPQTSGGGFSGASTSGTFNGIFNGTIEIAGTKLSFFINFDGTYSFVPPSSTQEYTISVTLQVLHFN